MIFFVSTLLIFTEISSSAAPDLQTTKYKTDPEDGGQQDVVGSDEEKGLGQAQAPPIRRGATNEKLQHDGHNQNHNIPAEVRMTDNFTWQHLRYVVPVGKGQTRQLLDDISGYIVPGKLTALMGESGAGKVSCFWCFWCSCYRMLLI